MVLAIVLVIVTVAVVALLVAPLTRSTRAVPERGQFDRAVYRDQLKELERDLARGLIDAGEAATARLEIERRLLAAEAADEAGERSMPRPAASPVLAIALAIAVPAAAALLYLYQGSPTLPDEPFAARSRERALAAQGNSQDLVRTEAALQAKVKANPDSDADWLLLAQTEAALGHWQSSADAYRTAMRLTKGRPDVTADYGEMLVMAAEGIVTPHAHEAFLAALGRDPKNVVARYYLALAEKQEGRPQAAIEDWRKLAEDQPEASPLRNELNQRMADAAREAGLPAPEPVKTAAPAASGAGPSAQDMAAAQMSPEDRQKMIRGMVDRLAAELEQRPDDLNGWLRLARAYGVLGEHDKAADAYEHAAKLKPDDPGILLGEAQALMPDHRPQTPVPERAVALLKRVVAIEPNAPAALWYLGLAAAQQRHFDEATTYWQRLLAALPPDSEERPAVAAAIDALKGK